MSAKRRVLKFVSSSSTCIASSSPLALQPVHKSVFEGIPQKPIDQPGPLSIRADIVNSTVSLHAATFGIHVHF
jgi:hypothetical protein